MTDSVRASLLRKAFLPVLIAAGLFTSGCNARSTIFEKMADGFARKFGVTEIRAPELIKRLAAGRPTLLIDVREPAEQSVSILAGAVRISPRDNPAELKQYRDFLNRHAAGDSEASKQALVVVYCAGGYRSAEAITRVPSTERAQTARPPILNLHGGIIAYANAGGPLIEPTTGKAVNIVHGYNRYWATFVEAPARAVLKPPIK